MFTMSQQGIVVLTLSVLLVAGSGLGSSELEDVFMEEAFSILEECGNKSFSICVKERALKYMEQLPNVLNIGAGLKMVPTDGVKRSSRYFNPATLPIDPIAREEVLDSVLMDKLVNYISSHTFQFQVPEDALENLRRSFEDTESNEEELVEGRKRKKKGGKKGNRGLFMLLQLKAAVIGAIMLKLIGLVAFKALMMAKIALLISSIIVLKKAVDKKHHSSTYEVISAHPYEHDHGHYDRSFAIDMAYNAYNDVNNIK